MKKQFTQINDFSNAYIGVKGEEESVNRFLEMVASSKFATELTLFEDIDEECDADDEAEPQKIYPISFKDPIIGSFSYYQALEAIMNFMNNEIHDAVKPNAEIGLDDYRFCGEIFTKFSNITENEIPTVINTMMTTAKSGWKDLKCKYTIDLFTKDGSFYKKEDVNKKVQLFIIPFLIRHEELGKDVVREDFDKIKELLKLYSELIDGVEIYISTYLEPTFRYNEDSGIIEYDTESMVDDGAFAIYSANTLWAATTFTNVKDNDDNEYFCRFII